MRLDYSKIKRSEALLKEYKKLESVRSAESSLKTRTTIAILGKLENTENLTLNLIKSIERIKHRKRKPSKWQLFMGEGMREGKTMRKIAIEWKQKKEGVK